MNSAYTLHSRAKACYNKFMVSLRKFSWLVFILLFSALCFLPEKAAAQSQANNAAALPAGGGKVWVIPIKGDIQPSLAVFVRREAQKAVSQGAEFLVFEIDTFGGRVDSALQITSFIMSIKGARTIAWVNNSENSMGVSWSAGALIAFSCAEIYMAPGTSMGAAAPVVVSSGGAAEGAGEKSVAAVRSQMAALAERNGHPVGIALAMVDYDVELWEVTMNGETRAITLTDLERLEKTGSSKVERVGIISPQGKLLSLTAGEALRYGLAAGLAESQEALFAAVGASGEVVESNPSLWDSLISFLTSGPVQVILILLGLVMIFLEIQTPGFGIPGITAVIAFLIVFGSSALLGRVGSLEIILFLAGLGCLAVEIFVLPGFGVVGITGFIFIGLSLVLSMQDFVIPSFQWQLSLLGRNVLVVFVGLVASVLGIAIIALAGPRIKIFDGLTLKAQITGTSGGPDPDSPAGKAVAESKAAGGSLNSGLSQEDEENLAALVGKTGVSESVLRPSGRALIESKIYTVEADNEYIDEGRGILVTRVRGNRIVVRRV